MWIYKTDRKNSLKYLGIKGQDIYSVTKNGSAKKVYKIKIHIFGERTHPHTRANT